MKRVPGITAIHALITDNCRDLRTDEGAIDEALARVRREAVSLLDSNEKGRRTEFHIVLTVDRQR